MTIVSSSLSFYEYNMATSSPFILLDFSTTADWTTTGLNLDRTTVVYRSTSTNRLVMRPLSTFNPTELVELAFQAKELLDKPYDSWFPWSGWQDSPKEIYYKRVVKFLSDYEKWYA